MAKQHTTAGPYRPWAMFCSGIVLIALATPSNALELPRLPAPTTQTQEPANHKGVTNLWVDTELRQVVQDIASQTGTVILCDQTVQGMLSMSVKDMPLQECLEGCAPASRERRSTTLAVARRRRRCRRRSTTLAVVRWRGSCLPTVASATVESVTGELDTRRYSGIGVVRVDRDPTHVLMGQGGLGRGPPCESVVNKKVSEKWCFAVEIKGRAGTGQSL